MAEKEKNKVFALLGKNISYSFSRSYFTEKFDLLGLNNHSYVNFDIQSIDEFPPLFEKYKEVVCGMNVTIPYKEEIFQYLDKVDKKAKKIGAVNTITITKKGKLKGFNTDYYGFKKSLKPLLKPHHKKALILGTGGASKAVAYALKKLNIEFLFVSRNPRQENEISYQKINEALLKEYTILINCTPLGTHPNIEQSPNIPYKFLNENHLLYDLIYNPSITTFLQKGLDKDATIKNGLEMLELQAEKAWKIWNK
ncbi:shikimate dehydrogenase [Tenacibaculum sp. IB213877]|uniref:shikimate dehydrogenase family protein n=1 Tax=Tenacibaculum sp. IB213877 TaxID=3097351 RepID=UPI002A59FA42|nr:shikimate dehydrogenase [Tenacibaculum sp. IB213877]MDY0781083.1 shikimate dehydrogenase [Tenacibaculum sp. IB213877]